jgi:hypothetical protein
MVTKALTPMPKRRRGKEGAKREDAPLAVSDSAVALLEVLLLLLLIPLAVLVAASAVE